MCVGECARDHHWQVTLFHKDLASMPLPQSDIPVIFVVELMNHKL